MRSGRLILVLLLFLALAGIFWVYERFLQPFSVRARGVPAGHQELAWLFPATNGDAWERLIASLVQLQKDWAGAHPAYPRLHLDLKHAFLERTVSVPEVALWFEGQEATRLWVRWYKLSGEFNSERWLQILLDRGTPPLAILGGDVSSRCLTQAQALEKIRGSWQGKPPLFLITTATAERYDPRANQQGALVNELMKAYPGRSFRFCFTNTYMAQAVIDFLQEHREVWRSLKTDPAAIAGTVGQANAWGVLGQLAQGRYLEPLSLYTLAWNDDLYSHDLADRFSTVFVEYYALGQRVLNNYIDYSVGDPFWPNPSEERTLDLYLTHKDIFQFHNTHQMLALPTGTQRARRFLRTLCRRAPRETRHLVAVSGDSITFNNIFRDRDIAWNILDLPVPLVFFSHRNPIDREAGFQQEDPQLGIINNTATNDVLLNRDILEAFLLAAHDGRHWEKDTDRIQERLRQVRWYRGRIHHPFVDANAKDGVALFTEEGDRRKRTGEHVVWLHPLLEHNRFLSQAVISVWTTAPPGEKEMWQPVGQPLPVGYNRPFIPVEK